MSPRIPTPAYQNIAIRDARPADMPAITELCVASFTTFQEFGPPWFDDAGILPSKLAGLDNSLGRLAITETDGQPVGHAQWTIVPVFLAGRTIKAAWLAPLSVHPDWQRGGVGGRLMRDGIELLRARGVSLLIILGHSWYYPRFGLLTHCHGRHGLSIPLPAALDSDPPGWRLRPVGLGDEQACRDLWQGLCARVAGATPPGPGLLPWTSHTRDIAACILERQGKVVGYARADLRPAKGPGQGILRFLAGDAESARVLAGRLAGWAQWQGPRLGIPLAPSAAAVRALFPGQDIQEDYQYWDAGMAMDLTAGPGDSGAALASDISRCLEAIRQKSAPPLFVEWPPLFDF